MFTNPKALLATVLVVVLALALPALAQPPGQTKCFPDWATAASVVEGQQLITVEMLGRQFRRQKLGAIVKTELCRADDNYIYRLVVRRADGRFRSTAYDARRGIEIGVAESKR